MITSKHIISLSDSYFKAQWFGSNYVEVYVNPTKSELLLLSEPSKKETGKREIRFVINPESKEIFVCDAFLGLHPNLRKITNLSDDNIFVVYGEAQYDGSKFVTKNCSSEMFSLRYSPKYQSEVQKFFKFNWSWTNQYVTGIENYVRSLKT